MEHKFMKKIDCFFIVVTLVVTAVTIPQPMRLLAATSISNMQITCYTKDCRRVTTYRDKNLTTSSGYIDIVDKCKIKAVYENGSVCVEYPVPGGVKTAYAYSKDFFGNIDFSKSTMKLGKTLTVYRRSSGGDTVGTVYSSDDIMICGAENGRTQIIYAITGGYKMGWVPGNYSIAGGSTSSNSGSTCLSSSQAKKVLFSAVYYANLYPDLKAAFGYDEGKLWRHYNQHGIREGRSASPIFDPVFYLKNNPDLQQAFKNDYVSAYNHWVRYGCSEGRISSKYYYGLYYRNKYSDLQKAFFQGGSAAQNYYNLAVHYLTWGISEKRAANGNGYLPSGMEQNTTNISDNNGLCSPVPLGCRFNRKTNDNGWYGYHDININVSTQTPVYALCNGTVTYKQAYTNFSGVEILTSYGNFIEFTSADGVYKAKYCHLNRFVGAGQIISSGQTKEQSGSSGVHTIISRNVKKGEIIGYIGKTGKASGVHLHFELRKNGTRIDPTSVISNLK